MEQVYKHFIAGFSAVVGVFLVLLSAITVMQSGRSAEHGLNQLIEAVESKYRQEQKTLTEKLTIVETDYINRAQAIAYIIQHDAQSHLTSNLQRIKIVMGVEKINITNQEGVIVYSANRQVIGTDLKNYPEAVEFYDLSTGARKDPVIAMGEYKDENDGMRDRDYVIVPLQQDGLGAIQITFYSDEVDSAMGKARLQTLVRTFVTEYTTTVALFDQSGEMQVMTENNQNLRLAEAKTPEETLAFLDKAKDGTWTFANDRVSYAVSREFQGYHICAFYDMTSDVKEYVLMMLGMVLISGVTVLLVVSLLRRYIYKYLISDFERVQEDIDAFVNGDDQRAIRPCSNPAMESLNESVRRLCDGYRHKSERLNKIVGAAGSNIAAFECLSYTSSIFISDNMQQVLGLSNERMAELQTIKGFTDFIRALYFNKDKDGMVKYHDKWLKIVYHHVEHEHYGVIIDKTEEVNRELETQQALRTVQRSAVRDPLTGLFNRNGFGERVAQIMESEPEPHGVMFMFDMDNFKAINDTMGHPEGDRALQRMAEILNRAFRKTDVVGRLGGDEFIAFVPNAMTRETLEQKLSDILADTRATLSYYEPHKVTVSIGAAFRDAELNEYKALYEAADSALYIAKELGKNRYYINADGIRCMEKSCKHCRAQCPRRDVLGLT